MNHLLKLEDYEIEKQTDGTFNVLHYDPATGWGNMVTGLPDMGTAGLIIVNAVMVEEAPPDPNDTEEWEVSRFKAICGLISDGALSFRTRTA